MKGFLAFLALLAALVIAEVARGGHELPIYPSYYPHDILIETLAPELAAGLLRGNKIQAYVGPGLNLGGPLPESMRAVESLGSFVLVHVNPQSPLARDEASTCAVARAAIRELAGSKGGELVLHPYPVTPFHGDYLYHADLADAAKARLSDDVSHLPQARRSPKLRARDELTSRFVRAVAPTDDWDAEVETVSAYYLASASTFAIDGWLGPPWSRTGWFQAALLLADSIDDPAKRARIDADLQRLKAHASSSAVERINLERELVSLLVGGCRKTVAGYTVRREYISADYYAGIENIGYDALAGLASPIFIRTVKLKDFPWNGWLALGTAAQATAAWNPIAGFTDSYGRLMWFALGDPAVIPSPYDAGWMLNRIADVRSDPGR